MALQGTYLLVMEIDIPINVVVGRLGKQEFKRGYYVYVGSAMNNLVKRVERHRRKVKKKRWHIDYLTTLGEVRIKEVWIVEKERKEKAIGKMLLHLATEYVEGFGCSDSPLPSHLFYFPTYSSFLDALNELKREFRNLIPYNFKRVGI